MMWLRSHRRTSWICGLTLLLPFLLYFDTLLGLWGARHDYQSEIDNLVPRIARLQGLIGHEDQLRESSATGSQEVVKLVYPASGDRATVSAALQTSIRQILTDAGLTVKNSQVLPIREEANFDYISIRVTVEGELSALDVALTGIAKFRPLLLVESLDARPVRSSRRETPSQTVNATLQLLSLRALL